MPTNEIIKRIREIDSMLEKTGNHDWTHQLIVELIADLLKTLQSQDNRI